MSTMGRNGEIDAAPPSSVLQVAWNRYLHQLDKKPLRTKVLIDTVLSGTRVSASAPAPEWLTPSGVTRNHGCVRV